MRGLGSAAIGLSSPTQPLSISSPKVQASPDPAPTTSILLRSPRRVSIRAARLWPLSIAISSHSILPHLLPKMKEGEGRLGNQYNR